MYLFWDIAIHPILKHLQPETILEIGSDRGHTTEKLLSYCQQNEASLHVIDPLPKYDTEEWKKRHGDTVTFHKELSLNALPIAPIGDLILIDGDHNWYTVFHELKLIEKRCRAEQRPFPVVLLHDIDWPYGRRDLYYNPENISPGYLHAYKQQGLRLDSPSLAETGGFNSHLNHSIYENGLQNGVRTAVEDFIEDNQLSKVSFYSLMGFHGLGILITDACQQKYPQLASLLQGLQASAELESFIHLLERKRLEGRLEKLECDREIEKLGDRLEDLQQSKLSEANQYEKEIEELESQLRSLQQSKQKEIEELESQLRSLQQSKQKEIEELGSQLESLQRNRLGEANQYEKEIEELGDQLKSLQQGKQKEIEELGDQLRSLQQSKQKEIEELGDQLRSLQKSRLSEANQYEKEIEELGGQLRSLQKSRLSEANQYEKEIEELGDQLRSLQKSRLSEANQYEKEIEELKEKLREDYARIAQSAEQDIRYEKEIEELREDYARIAQSAEQDIRWLIGWVEELSQSITSILNTNRWKIGNFLYTAYRKIKFQSLDEPPERQLSRLMEGMRAWQKKYEARRDREKSLENTRKVKPQQSESNLVKAPQAKLRRDESNLKVKTVPTKPGQNEARAKAPHPEDAKAALSVQAEVLDKAPKGKVDIVVCIHNALDDVKLCLDSIERETSLSYHLYLVNDGSNEETTLYLRRFAADRSQCTLLENKVAGGYTVAANCGLRASTADCVVLLNSDTIVTSNWLELLLECLHSNPKIGIASPLSNAATWQSIPEISAPAGGWAVNELPNGFSPNDMATLVGSVSRKQFPQVPFLNGFCLCLKRELINTIGYLDEKAFPKGYGEENDYCLRATDAGFTLAIADSAYVFHAKSKSYGKERRSELAEAGNRSLQEKHGQEKIATQLKLMKENSLLGEMRDRIRHELNGKKLNPSDSTSPTLKGESKSPRILFLLPVRGGGGGAHSVVQETMGMQEMHVDARVATQGKYKAIYQKNYPSFNTQKDLFCFYSNKEELVKKAGDYDIVIATIFTSVVLLQAILEKNPTILPAYYVQDYEPWFCKSEPSQWEQAYDSYTAIPGSVLFAKTRWLCDLVAREHGVEVAKVSPSLDRKLYYSGSKSKVNDNNIVRITAMIRPATPRRGAARTMRVLSKIHEKFGKQVGIEIFGCEDSELVCHAFDRDFPYTNHGILTREEVAKLLRRADIFVDYSDYQAFGRTGLEAMACGCVTVLPLKGGTSEYASHGENALLADTDSEDDCYRQLARLVADTSLRTALCKHGIATSSKYSIEKAAASEIEVLQAALQRRRGT